MAGLGALRRRPLSRRARTAGAESEGQQGDQRDRAGGSRRILCAGEGEAHDAPALPLQSEAPRVRGRARARAAQARQGAGHRHGAERRRRLLRMRELPRARWRRFRSLLQRARRDRSLHLVLQPGAGEGQRRIPGHAARVLHLPQLHAPAGALEAGPAHHGRARADRARSRAWLFQSHRAGEELREMARARMVQAAAGRLRPRLLEQSLRPRISVHHRPSAARRDPRLPRARLARLSRGDVSQLRPAAPVHVHRREADVERQGRCRCAAARLLREVLRPRRRADGPLHHDDGRGVARRRFQHRLGVGRAALLPRAAA